jgi:hypothetical protein
MFKKTLAVLLLAASSVSAQTFDSSSYVETNNSSTTNSTVSSSNANTNINTNTSTSNNTNTNANTNINSGHTTSESVNTNTNTNSSSTDNTNRNIQSGDVTNRNINDSKSQQTIKQPPPSAVAPSMMSGGNNDLCTVGSSGAIQTQILGVSAGGVVRDMNCERLKNAKTLFDMGMKVAAVTTMCQDRRVFDAMWNAGTPCPFDGLIGEPAKIAWQENPNRIPQPEQGPKDDFYKKTGWGALLGLLFFVL